MFLLSRGFKVFYLYNEHVFDTALMWVTSNEGGFISTTRFFSITISMFYLKSWAIADQEA